MSSGTVRRRPHTPTVFQASANRENLPTFSLARDDFVSTQTRNQVPSWMQDEDLAKDEHLRCKVDQHLPENYGLRCFQGDLSSSFYPCSFIDRWQSSYTTERELVESLPGDIETKSPGTEALYPNHNLTNEWVSSNSPLMDTTAESRQLYPGQFSSYGQLMKCDVQNHSTVQNLFSSPYRKAYSPEVNRTSSATNWRQEIIDPYQNEATGCFSTVNPVLPVVSKQDWSASDKLRWSAEETFNNDFTVSPRHEYTEESAIQSQFADQIEHLASASSSQKFPSSDPILIQTLLDDYFLPYLTKSPAPRSLISYSHTLLSDTEPEFPRSFTHDAQRNLPSQDIITETSRDDQQYNDATNCSRAFRDDRMYAPCDGITSILSPLHGLRRCNQLFCQSQCLPKEDHLSPRYNLGESQSHIDPFTPTLRRRETCTSNTPRTSRDAYNYEFTEYTGDASLPLIIHHVT